MAKKKEVVETYIDNKGEYRYSVKSANNEIIADANEWFKSRTALLKNMKLCKVDLSQVPARITRRRKKS